MDNEGKLTIKDLMNFSYCERLIYFENVLRIPQATTIKELKGRELHNVFTQKSKRTKIVREFERLPKLYALALESKELNFRTVLDCLILDKAKNEAFPIEYKDAKKPERLYRTFMIQILAESLLVKENMSYSVPFAFIKFEQTDDLVKIPITDYDLEKVRQTIAEINKIVQTEAIPEPTPYVKRCKDCGYRKICRRA
ncbi:MAG: CRISPR-associated protein Cas4 [Candidatus ainarchaeum sp.]|nr:CRISPR-associated protein Cas4 [Candidatus ainarchaeum sp.]